MKCFGSLSLLTVPHFSVISKSTQSILTHPISKPSVAGLKHYKCADCRHESAVKWRRTVRENTTGMATTGTSRGQRLSNEIVSDAKHAASGMMTTKNRIPKTEAWRSIISSLFEGSAVPKTETFLKNLISLCRGCHQFWEGYTGDDIAVDELVQEVRQ